MASLSKPVAGVGIDRAETEEANSRRDENKVHHCSGILVVRGVSQEGRRSDNASFSLRLETITIRLVLNMRRNPIGIRDGPEA